MFEKFGWSVKNGQMSSIWAKGLMIVCVLSDLTRLPLHGEGRKPWCIIIKNEPAVQDCENIIYPLSPTPPNQPMEGRKKEKQEMKRKIRSFHQKGIGSPLKILQSHTIKQGH